MGGSSSACLQWVFPLWGCHALTSKFLHGASPLRERRNEKPSDGRMSSAWEAGGVL